MRVRTIAVSLAAAGLLISSNGVAVSVQLPVDSVEMEERIIYQIPPTYPQEARENRIQGIVLIDVVIDDVGQIAEWEVTSGHLLLADAAVEAVSQWLYEPYTVNGEPVEVITRITVNFSLN